MGYNENRNKEVKTLVIVVFEPINQQLIFTVVFPFRYIAGYVLRQCMESILREGINKLKLNPDKDRSAQEIVF